MAIQRLVKPGVDHKQAQPSLDIDHVYVAYDGRLGEASGVAYALEDITLRVDQAERIAVVGPNGAGKSTLFRLIAGTLAPDEGEVHIFGHDPDGHICIAYVPQRSQIDWSFPVTVEDVVMMGRVGQIGLFRRPSKQDWAIVRQSLERVGAADLAHKQIGELSGGQQQRVFLARALAQEAELLLLDEPLNGLDVRSQEAILGILDQLQADGVTVLLATHDLDLAAARFDRIMLLNRRVVALGPPDEVLQPQNLVTAFGGQLHLIDHEGETLALTDSCCDGDDHDHAAHG